MKRRESHLCKSGLIIVVKAVVQNARATRKNVLYTLRPTYAYDLRFLSDRLQYSTRKASIFSSGTAIDMCRNLWPPAAVTSPIPPQETTELVAGICSPNKFFVSCPSAPKSVCRLLSSSTFKPKVFVGTQVQIRRRFGSGPKICGSVV